MLAKTFLHPRTKPGNSNFYSNLPPFSLLMTLIPLILLWHNTSATTSSRQLKEGIVVLIAKSKEDVQSLILFVLDAI
jgi:hypothetical protein